MLKLCQDTQWIGYSHLCIATPPNHAECKFNIYWIWGMRVRRSKQQHHCVVHPQMNTSGQIVEDEITHNVCVCVEPNLDVEMKYRF